MAQCDVCFTRLPPGSVACPRCGRQKRQQRLKFALGALIAVQALLIVAYVRFKPDLSLFPHVSMSTATVGATPGNPDTNPHWAYFETRDDLLNDVTRHARVASLTDAAPNEHVSPGVLELRASPTYGTSVVITFKRSAIEAVSEKCELRAKFDAQDVQVYHASGSLGTSNAMLVIDDTHDFTGHLAAAHTLLIDAKLSPKIERVAKFDVAGLNWN